MRLKSDDSAFFPQRYTSVTGIEVELPPFTLRKDEQVRHVLKRVLEDNAIGLSTALVSEDSRVKLLGLSLSRAPQDLLEIGSLILDRDPEWVEENCDTADLIELVGSFVLSPVSPDEQERVEQEGEVWTLARLIDFLAHEYKWTVDDVLDRTRWELRAVLHAATERHEEHRRQMEDHRNSRRRGGAGGRKSFVRPGRRKNISKKKNEENINALRAFGQSRGMYQKIQGGDSA